jgi:hypothetical protein
LSNSMPSSQKSDREQSVNDALHTLIAEQVILRLGRPTNLLFTKVHKLWEGRYRANVFVGPHVAAPTLLQSYFLTTDADGNILDSSPPIARMC